MSQYTSVMTFESGSSYDYVTNDVYYCSQSNVDSWSLEVAYHFERLGLLWGDVSIVVGGAFSMRLQGDNPRTGVAIEVSTDGGATRQTLLSDVGGELERNPADIHFIATGMNIDNLRFYIRAGFGAQNVGGADIIFTTRRPVLTAIIAERPSSPRRSAIASSN